MGGRIKSILVAVMVMTVCIAVLSYIKSSDVKEAEAFDVPKIAVHVKGAVANPGLYEFEPTSRVADAVDAAGGALENADIDAINLAQFLEDGTEVIVPVKKEAVSKHDTYGAKININTATATQLCTLNGIGSVTAENIIAYRTEHGSFAVKEEIMNVSGIGEKKFENIKNKICV